MEPGESPPVGAAVEHFMKDLNNRLNQLDIWLKTQLQGPEAQVLRRQASAGLAAILAQNGFLLEDNPVERTPINDLSTDLSLSSLSPGGEVIRGGSQDTLESSNSKPSLIPVQENEEDVSQGPDRNGLSPPPGHFVSQLICPPAKVPVRYTASLPNIHHNTSDHTVEEQERVDVRESAEGIAQLGQLLCRMMLFPIFRSNNEYLHWKKVFRTIVRIRLPEDCRRRVWLIVSRRTIPSLACKNLRREVAECDIMDLCIQIEKDLHRTSSNEFYRTTAGRSMLARVLLAYSQHNKAVGYCQSLNFIAANLLLLMNKNEEDAFAALAVLVDQLPQNYFKDLECLAVDMLVFDELMRERLPHLHAHMGHLLTEEMLRRGGNVQDEPQLTDMFIGHWFPTIFAMAFPQDVLYRVWDSVLFDGDEMLFRVGLAIFSLLEDRLLRTLDPLHFYSEMKILTSDLPKSINCDEMIKLAYNLYPFPLPRLSELRAIFTKRRAEQSKQEQTNRTKTLREPQVEDTPFMSFFKFGKKAESEASSPNRARQQEMARTAAGQREAMVRSVADELAGKKAKDMENN